MPFLCKKSKHIASAVKLNKAIRICETKRIYFFPNGHTIVLNNLLEIVVRPSGSHRIKTADGKFHIIASGWLHIEITSKGDWLF